jgi:hypothetical protein
MSIDFECFPVTMIANSPAEGPPVAQAGFHEVSSEGDELARSLCHPLHVSELHEQLHHPLELDPFALWCWPGPSLVGQET